MKIINSRIHGILDYIIVIFLWIAPSLFNFTEFTGNFIYGLGAVHLVLTLFTDYSAGMFGLIPLPAHGIIEFIVSLFLVISPWIFGITEETDRYFIIGFGIVIFLIYILSSYQTDISIEE